MSVHRCFPSFSYKHGMFYLSALIDLVNNQISLCVFVNVCESLKVVANPLSEGYRVMRSLMYNEVIYFGLIS